MKIIPFFAIGIVLLGSCGNPSEKAGTEAWVAPRNYTIHPQNAYNNLFLDSTKVEQFIAQQHFNDTLANGMRSFYNVRNYEFGWFGPDGLSEQAMAFRSLYEYSKDSVDTRKVLDERLDHYMSQDDYTISATNEYAVKTELLLTWRFIQYVWDRYPDPKNRAVLLERFLPVQKRETLSLAKEVLAEQQENAITNEAYVALKKELQHYVEIAGNGGWAAIPETGKTYEKGATAAVITAIKKRVWSNTKDTSAVFDDSLATTIKNFRAANGMEPGSSLTPAVIKALNVPVEVHIQQILVNLERMRWMPAHPTGRWILANIPEFMLHVREGNQEVFNMKVVVGKEGHSTTLFSGDLNQIVFSPYWNVPPSIVKKEIMPAMEDNKDYLEEHHMEITGEQNGLPVIRQTPGTHNDLGQVKFLFPNSFNIYFHDTPHKELFNRNKRDYSHGCIRLAEPAKLAEYLLQDKKSWTPQKINAAMNSGEEKYVVLKNPVPVLIDYYTAWVNLNGTLQFRDDIYGHDSSMAQKLFIKPLL